MDIDRISMTALLILMIIGFVIAFGTYLMIVSENMNKTDEERRLEDEEQMEYLKNYKRKGRKHGKNK